MYPFCTISSARINTAAAKTGCAICSRPASAACLTPDGGEGAQKEEAILTVDIWPDPWALDRTDPALRRQMVFPLTDEGRAAAAEYLSSAYSTDLALWKQRPSILDCEPWSPPPKDEDAESGESK